VTSETEILEILPVLAGQHVRAALHSLYVARVNGKEKVFKTGEIRTEVVLIPGKWISVGGLRSEGEDTQRINLGLSRSGESQWEDLKLEVMAEILIPKEAQP